jgi:assimilatory nitrate reductase catalytic subunit
MNSFIPPTRTTCPYCGVGCGVLATPTGPESAEVRGDPGHPANFGRLCSKGLALGETLALETRLLHPEIGGRRVSWDEALDTVAERFRAVVAEHGPDAVAMYVSGQLLTEDYYVANKLMKGFLGTANIDTNSRLCMASTVAGQKRGFGGDVVPGCYEDLERADLIVLVGSNAAWCHPVLFRRIQAAREKNPKLRVVNIDPRRTATGQSADLHLGIRPGTDVILFNGLLNHLRQEDALNYHYIESHVAGFGEALESARATAPSIPAVAAACGLPEADVAEFFRLFARTEKTVTAWSQGVNQSSAGTDKVNAILNVHLATGRIGRPGMGPLSFTGQPNAMGGREVGGLANQLAAHLDLGDPRHRELVREFWNAPRVAGRPGLKAVDLFRAIGEGRVKAVWIVATNPAVSLPDADAVRAALEQCEFVVVSDCEAATDLAPYAHVSLPALAFGEKDGTVTNSERRISRQRPFLPAPGEARPDWWAVAEVARRLGFGEAFGYRSARDIFVEHARLSGFRNGGERLFDISALAELDEAGYNALEPVQWPVTAAAPGGTARLFGEGGFPTADGRARMPPLAARPPANPPDGAFPLILNTGRIRDQWHTMTRTGKTARLTEHLPEPFAELHPDDAARLGIADGSLVRLESRHGETLARARVTDEQQPGAVFMPMHWTGQTARQGLVNRLVNPVADPVSGEPESKHTPVRIEPWQPAWQGFLLARHPVPAAAQSGYHVLVRARSCWRHELAGLETPADWGGQFRDWLGLPREDRPDSGEWLEFADRAAGRYRAALLRENRLVACLFVGPDHGLPARDWLSGLFAKASLEPADRRHLLRGSAGPGGDAGPVVCACHGVGLATLERTIREQNLRTVDAIGAATRAGTGCGSCIPELKALLERAR